MNFSRKQWRCVAALFLVAGSPGALRDAEAQQLLAPAELKAAARAIFKNEKSSVVWVTAKVRLRRIDDGSAVPGEEAGLGVLGTVVGKSGLTVVSNTDFDPGRTLREAREDALPEFSFIEIVLEDGVAVPATVVYRDAELDLAYLKPDEHFAKQRGAVFRPVDTSSGHSLEVMDDVVLLSRLDASMDWAPRVVLGNVSAVVRGSRTYYLTSVDVEAGTPVYSGDGSLLGIGVYRISEGRALGMVTLSSETVHVISEIAEATGFLAERSDEIGTSLTEGLTLSLADLKARPAVAEEELSEAKLDGSKETIPAESGADASMALPKPGGATASVSPPEPSPVEPEAEPSPSAPEPGPEPKPASKPAPKPEAKPAPKPVAAPVRSASQRPPVPVAPEAAQGSETEMAGETAGAEDDGKGGFFKWPFGGLKIQSTVEKRKGKESPVVEEE